MRFMYNFDASKEDFGTFEFLDQTYIADCDSQAIHLRHKKTGLEVYHLLNEDKENLCCFSFRTPPETSNGVAHIIEHSSLCGSEKYPLKDPFIHMENQSLNTYLNALTGCDHTMYPVSSVVEDDYFNLVSVYADSVFFPNLKKEAFLQEAYRLTVDENKNYSIQGVVYNEMKGVFSQFFNAEDDVLSEAFYDGTIYALSSGGNPSVIPELTYEEYLKFYREKYTPENCLIFLYGNIPTKKQLDFFQKNFIDRLEQRAKIVTKKTPLEIIKSQKVKKFDELKEFYGIGPKVSEVTDPSICLSWYLGECNNLDDYIETNLIQSILFGHDGSPLRKALINSELGIDIDDLSGLDGGTKFRTISFGLKGIKLKNKDKMCLLILSEIEKVIQNGINKDDLDSALLSAEFVLKEVKRDFGPYSLTLMRKVVRSWVYGKPLDTYLRLQEAFDRFKKRLSKDSRYLEKLMQKYFIDNKMRSVIIVTPTEEYTKLMADREKENIERLKKIYSEQEVIEQNKKLTEYQQKDESELVKCLPTIDIKTLKYEIPDITCDISWLEYELENAGVDNARSSDSDSNNARSSNSGSSSAGSDCKIPFGICVQPTNSINYLDVRFPIDVLESEDYFYVAFLMSVITEIGWGNKTYEQCQTIINKTAGAFSCGTETGSLSKSPKTAQLAEKYKEYNFAGRDWLYFRIKTLNHMTSQCLDFLYECLTSPDFYDKKRMKNLFDQYIEDFSDSISSSGYKYLVDRCSAEKTASTAADEIVAGLSAFNFYRKNKNIKKISARMESIFKKIVNSGAFIYITCDKDSVESAKNDIKAFAKRLNLKAPQNRNPSCNYDSLVKLTRQYGMPDEKLECYSKDIQVGFSACVFDTSDSVYGTREAVAKNVLSSWLSNSLLWEQIRTISGAYGAYSNVDSIEKIFNIMTYRDPDPLKSISLIEQCLKTASEREFSDEEVQKTDIGVFSYDLTPKTPKSKGGIALNRTLYCISNEDVRFRIETTLKINAEDVHKAAVSVYNSFLKTAKCAVLCSNSAKKTSKKNFFRL